MKLQVELAPFSLFLNQISRFAVPLFFIISGFVLELNNKSGLSYTDFFKKRASKIIAPFLLWSVVYFAIANSFDITRIASMKFFWTIVAGTASYHLYFIPTLILFYLSFPFLHLHISLLKKPAVLVTLVVVQAAILYRDYYIETLKINYDLRIALLSFLMFILGMVASHNVERIYSFLKRYIFPISVLTIVVALFIFFHVYDMTRKLSTSRFIYNQHGPLNYIYTSLLAGLLYYVLEKTQFLKKWFIKLSRLSFFVFFVHVLILDIMWDQIVLPLAESNGRHILTTVWFDLIVFTAVSAISFGIAYIIHKIPYASKITG